MRSLGLAFGLVVGLGLVSAPALLQQKGGDDESGPYQVVADWPREWAPSGYIWGSGSGVFAESPNRVYLAVRGLIKLPEALPPTFTGNWGSLGQGTAASAKFELRDTIVVVDGTGKLIESWKQWDNLYEGGRGPHKIRISPYHPEKHVWIVDDRGQQVRKFTHDGKQLVMSLGEKGVAGTDETHFGEPTDIAFMPDGSLLIADGYKNARIVKFDKDGKFVMAWGSRGTGPGQFSLVHGIAVDANRRVYVADRPVLGGEAGGARRMGRIEVFDENGKFLDEWPGLPEANDILIDANQHAWVADGSVFKILEFDLNGKLLSSWGTRASFPGALWEPHQLSVDSEGSLYIADSFEGRTQKFKPRPGADRSRLAGMPVRATAKR